MFTTYGVIFLLDLSFNVSQFIIIDEKSQRKSKENVYFVDHVISCSGNSCIDVNECQTVGKQCEHRCLNSPGAYSCVCRSGFRLVNQTKCVADNDCRHFGPGACQHGCTKASGR